MAVHIGECFLQHTEQSDLHFAWQTHNRLLNRQRNAELAAPAVLIHIPPRGGEEPELIQEWGVQEVRNCPYLLDGVVSELEGLLDQSIRVSFMSFHLTQVDFQASEKLTDTVV